MKFKNPANRRKSDMQQDQTARFAINLRLMSAKSGRMNASWTRKQIKNVTATPTKALSLPVNPGVSDVEMNCKTVIRHARLPMRSDEPSGSNRMIFFVVLRCRKTAWLASFGKMKNITVSDPTATGTLIQKAQRQPQWTEMTPPRIGPDTVQTPMNKAPAASRNVRSPRGDETPIILIAPLMIPAAPVPEISRPAMKVPDVCAIAQTIEPMSRTLRLMKKIHLIAHKE